MLGDSLFVPEDFVTRFNSDLANDLGNLLNRTVAMINKYFDGEIPTEITEKTEFDDSLKSFFEEKLKEVENYMDDYHISDAIQSIWSYIARTNKYIDETSPWILAKSDDDKEKLKSVMFNLADSLVKIAIMIKPIMNETSNKILEQLGLSKELVWDDLYKENLIPEKTKVVSKSDILFVRLDKDEEIEYIKNAMHGNK